MLPRIVLIVMILFKCALFAEDQIHKFVGKHFLASYLECDLQAIMDLEGLVQAMDDAVKASGASILSKTSHVFSPNGLTLVYLLSESHASLHTYPEYGACFVDLFTCGDYCSSSVFDKVLRKYLRPGRVNARCFLRHENVDTLPLE